MTVLIMLIALGFALGVTPLVRQLAIRLHFVAVPRKDRAHETATPLMGGLALYIGFTVIVLVLAIGFEFLFPDVDTTLPLGELLMVFAGGTVIAGIGLWDDWMDMDSKVKLGLQFVPVLMLTLFTDIRLNMPIPDIINYGLTVCWFLYIINAINYMDNMDGVAGMTACVAGMFFTVIAVINGQYLVASLAAAISGVSFGFLRYNLFETENKIFMGDVGALFLGFLLAVIGIKLTFEAESPFVTWPVPVLVLGVPIFDTALVFISRMRRGQRFLDGGTDHLSHRFGRLGFGRFGVPFAIGLLGSGLGSAAIVIMHSDLTNSLAAQAFVGFSAIYLLYKLELRATYKFITGKDPEPLNAAVSGLQTEN